MARQNYIIEGNTVRRLDSVPVRVPRESEPKRKRTSSTVTRNRQKALRMNGTYVMFLAVSAVISLFVCMQYLMIQADNMKVNDEITTIEKEIINLTTQNDAVDYSINSFFDINRIIQVATEELGMVPTTKANVQLYESTQSEYINQYRDIPQ